MQFRTYRLIGWSGYVILGTLMITLCYMVSGAAGFIAFVGIVPIGVPITWWMLSRQEELMDEYGGELPFPGIWGYLGATLTEDEPPEKRDRRSNLASCPYCGQPTLTWLLQEHVRIVHPDQKGLKTDTSRASPPTLRCPVCSATFSTPEAVRDHIGATHGL